MREVKRSIVLAAANASNIAASATPVSGTAITLTAGALAGTVPEVARRILLTYGNEGSARTLVLTGTDRNGNVITETLAVPSGAGGTVATLQDFRTVTQAMPLGGGWTQAMTIGTNGVASTAWVVLDTGVAPQDVGLAAYLRGITANVTVEGTMDDPNTAGILARPVPMGQSLQATPIPAVNSGTAVTTPTMAAISADTVGKLAGPFLAVRMTVNSGATAGSIDFIVQQTGIWG